MKKLAGSIVLALAAIPLAVSAYTLTVNIDGDPTVYTVDSAEFSSDSSGSLLTVTGLDTGGGGSGPFAPVFTSGNFSKQENSGTTVGTVTATDQDGDTPAFSLTGGNDSSRFGLTSGGVLTFNAAPDYENPADAGGNNVYNLQVTATGTTGTSGEETTNKAITVTVTNDTSDDGGGGSCGAVPAGVIVSDPVNWANPGSQTTISLSSLGSKAMKFTSTSNPNYFGYVSIASTTGNSNVQRQVWISECPGTAYSAESSLCAKTGSSSTVVYWEQGGLNQFYTCKLDTNKEYYINVRNVNCTTNNCNVFRNIYDNNQP